MILTLLSIMHQFCDWKKLQSLQSMDNDITISTIDLIDESLVDNGKGTDSMIVFSNCDKLVIPGNCNDNNNNCDSCCLVKSGKIPSLPVAGKMSAEVTGRIPPPAPGITPESDCNSNNLANDVSFCSNGSMDFVQDNSDYQWFLEYGYKDQAHPNPGILSLSRSHEIGYYEELARNLDANLAEVEMEDFQSQDIHSILSTLHNDIQGLEEREMFASVSGSMMVKFDFDSSHSTSQDGNTSMSLCKSEPLFSPMRQAFLPTANLSVDSLDLSDDMNILVTCQANKNNYTIAFEGSTVMGSDSDFLDNAVEHSNDAGEISRRDGNAMVRSDSMYTTWSQLKQQSRGSDNGNTDDTGKSISMPDLCAQPPRHCMAMSVSSKLSSGAGSSDQSGSDPRTVKLYDLRKSILSESSSSGGDKNRPRNFSLVKLFMKQKGGSSDGMEQSSASECWGENSNERPLPPKLSGSENSHNQRRAYVSSTNVFSEAKPCRNINNNNSYVAGVDKACQTEGQCPIYVVYPNYTLPNLNFIKERHQVGNIDWEKIFLRGQKFTPPPSRRRPVSMDDMQSLKNKGFNHVQDWASLTFLLPKECKEFLEGIPELVAQVKDIKKPLYNIASASSGYRGSSTMLTSNTSDETQPKGILRDTASRYTCKTAKDTANMRRLEELMEISAVFGDSCESVTEAEMKKLRAQVSRFLSMQKELERVSERLSSKDSCLESSDGLKKTVSFLARGATPPNSPTVSQSHRTYQNIPKRLVEVPICEESDVNSDQVLGNTAPILAQKRDLIQDVQRSVEKVLRQSRGGNELMAQACLQHLCPSLYAVLNDGLRETLSSPFGAIPNSVWAVVEASSQQGPMARPLHELVQRLNREFVLTEPLLKVNAFFFGLLNVQALDGWLSYLRTQDGLLHKHYTSRGLFVLANALGSVREVVDKLVEILHPLSKISFNLDLLHQAKILHRSLSNINTLLEATSSEGLLSPSKQLMLLKLVQSIQSSAKEESDNSHGRAERRSNTKSTRPRPRSDCDLPSGRDIASAMKKRWSGVQLNSKLSKAFEQLGEDVEPDSLDDPPKSSSAMKRLQFSDDTSQDLSTTWTKENDADVPTTKDHKKLILSSLNRKDRTELDSGGGGGRKFKRLQQRWEQLSGRTDASVSPLSSPEHKPRETEEPCDIVPVTTPSPTTRLSRIPRLVTSPVRPSTAALALCTPKPQGAIKKQAQTSGPSRVTRPTAPRPLTAPPRAGQTVHRPTTLPYRTSTLPSRKMPSPASNKPNSMSLNRRPGQTQGLPRIVRTLTHRLPSDSGHLSFNEGERLRVVLEVDDMYLLCCSGAQKGLVPKSAVIPV